MSYKDLFNRFFGYMPKTQYQFNLPDASTVQSQQNFNDSNISSSKKTEIYPSLTVNEDYMKTKYNTLINSDIILRNFTINARGKQYNAFILKPLMLRNKSNSFDGSQNKVISEAVANNITVRKVKKFDLPSYLLGCLMPQNAVTQETNFEDVISGINSRKLWFVC